MSAVLLRKLRTDFQQQSYSQTLHSGSIEIRELQLPLTAASAVRDHGQGAPPLVILVDHITSNDRHLDLLEDAFKHWGIALAKIDLVGGSPARDAAHLRAALPTLNLNNCAIFLIIHPRVSSSITWFLMDPTSRDPCISTDAATLQGLKGAVVIALDLEEPPWAPDLVPLQVPTLVLEESKSCTQVRCQGDPNLIQVQLPPPNSPENNSTRAWWMVRTVVKFMYAVLLTDPASSGRHAPPMTLHGGGTLTIHLGSRL